MNVLDLSTTGIPVLNAFVCASTISGISVQKLTRGRINDDGTREKDNFEYLSSNYVKQATTNVLIAGDWTNGEVWPCFIFESSKSEDLRFRAGIFDQIIILVESQNDLTEFDNKGLLFGLFNEERNITAVDPFVASLPTVNTFTFSYSEIIDINHENHPYFTINKENINKVTGGFKSLNDTNLMARFLYSPDFFFLSLIFWHKIIFFFLFFFLIKFLQLNFFFSLPGVKIYRKKTIFNIRNHRRGRWSYHLCIWYLLGIIW